MWFLRQVLPVFLPKDTPDQEGYDVDDLWNLSIDSLERLRKCKPSEYTEADWVARCEKDLQALVAFGAIRSDMYHGRWVGHLLASWFACVEVTC